MLSTFFIYNSVMVVSVLFAFLSRIAKDNTGRRISLAITFLSLFLISALRSGVGADFENYETIFNNIDYFTADRIEPGFLWINKFLSYLGFPAQSIFVVMAFIVAYFVVLASRKVRRPEQLVLAYCLLFYLDSLNIIRQAAATAILLYAILCLIDRENKRFLLFVLLATSLHYSAILFLPIIFVNNIKFDKKMLLLTVLLTIVFIRISVIEILINSSVLSGTKYNFYLGSTIYNFESGFWSTVLFLLRYIVLFVAFLIPRRYYPQNLQRFRNITLILNVLLLLSIAVYFKFYIFHRFVSLFSVSLILSMVLVSQAKIRWRQPLILLCVIVPLIFFENDIRVFEKSLPGKGITPYKTVFERK